MQSEVKVKTLVLLGGGHSHVTVLKSFGMKPVEGVRLVLVTKDVHTPYSGMIPGYVAGHYKYHECHIDLSHLATFAGASLVHAAASHIDTGACTVAFHDRPPLRYDCLSIDVGITPASGAIPGFEHVTPVKPIDGFVARLDALLERVTHITQPLSIAVVGGGAGGVEIAFSIHHRLATRPQPSSNTLSGSPHNEEASGSAGGGEGGGGFTVTLVSRGNILPTHPPRARGLCLTRAKKCGLVVMEGTPVAKVETGRLVLEGGGVVHFEECLWCTQASPAAWLQENSLPKAERGFLAINEFLQSAGGPPEVFACGDVATSIPHPRPKAGVFAVRQGPPLTTNLRAFLTGAPLVPFKPQHSFLGLVSTGDKHAIATRGCTAFGADWLWRLKDYIDRSFMQKFGSDLPDMTAPTRPPPAAASTTDAKSAWAAASMRCRGCAAKVPPAPLSDLLSSIPGAPSTCVPVATNDDAVVIPSPPAGHVQLQTVDFISCCVDDLYLFGRIAALHALSDCFAMGATPSSALAIAQVPHCAPQIMSDDLQQMMIGAQRELQEAGCALSGGHSCQGSEVALGFTVTGHANPDDLLLKSNLRAGQALIITKPLGTGLIMRGCMLGVGLGEWLVGAHACMVQSNETASEVLKRHKVAACTDVTGFGLLEHALEMAQASKVGISIDAAAVPMLTGVSELVAAGVKSTAHTGNSHVLNSIHGTPRESQVPHFVELIDPQTSGGLLCGVEQDVVQAVLQDLRSAGYTQAAIVGSVLDSSVEDGAPLQVH